MDFMTAIQHYYCHAVPVSGDTAAQPSQFHKEKIETEDGE